MRRPLYAATALLALCAPEAVYWAGAKACPSPTPAKSCGVLVLGFPARADGRAHPMQRHRVEAAVCVMRLAGCQAMVLSGGSPHSPHVEAEVMAGLARESGIPEDQIILERSSRNTWENISHSLRTIEAWDAIYLVSDGVHVHRARRYLCRQRPDLCARARPAARYHPGELYGLKWLGALHEASNAARDLLLGRLFAVDGQPRGRVQAP